MGSAMGTAFFAVVALETGLRIESFSKVTLGILDGTRKYSNRRVDGKEDGLDPH